MSQGRRKWDSIDLLKLYSEGNYLNWNMFLTKCLANEDVEGLKKTMYGLQVSMDDLVKKKLNSEKIVDFFLRLEKSLENTAKKIFRKKYPNPCDQPLIAKGYSDFLEAKRKRDAEFEQFLRKSSF